MARPRSEQSKALREELSMQLVSGEAVDPAVLAEKHGMSVRSVQRMVKEITKELPADMVAKRMASEKQINCVIRNLAAIGTVSNEDGVRQFLETYSMKKGSGAIQITGQMRKLKKILDSDFGRAVIRPVLQYVDLSEFPFRR